MHRSFVINHPWVNRVYWTWSGLEVELKEGYEVDGKKFFDVPDPGAYEKAREILEKKVTVIL